MAIYFKSPAHKQRFLDTITAFGKVYDGKIDQEYGAALYILTAALWEKASSHASHDGIHFDDILEQEDLSGGESVLVRLAGNLFNGRTSIDPIEFYRLDLGNFNVVLTALRLRWSMMLVSDI